MSSNKTEYLQLHLWERVDEFRRDEFNENAALVDAGVKAAEEKAATALAAYQSTNDKALADGLNAQSAALNAYKGTNDAAVGALQNAAATIPKIEIGSYVGNGGYGVSNPSRLTFSFTPKLVIIVIDKVADQQAGNIFVNGQSFSSGMGCGGSSSDTCSTHLQWLPNGVQWYDNYAGAQLNENTELYRYFAIG